MRSWVVFSDLFDWLCTCLALKRTPCLPYRCFFFLKLQKLEGIWSFANTHECTHKLTQRSEQFVGMKRHAHRGRSDMSKSNLDHSLGLTWQLPAQAGTDADGVPVSSQWVVSLFSDRETIQSYWDKSRQFRGGKGEDIGTLQHLTEQNQKRKLFF